MSDNNQKSGISIVGAGIAGLTAAIAFQNAGYFPLVFEAAESLKPVGAGLGLAANAIKGFDRLGIKDQVIKRGRVLPSFTIMDEGGKTITQTDSGKVSTKFGLDNFTIHRASLHEVLLSKVSTEQLVTGKRCVGYRVGGNGKAHILEFADGSHHESDVVIVADGIHSSLRQKFVPNSQPRYAGYTCWRAVIDNAALKIDDSYEVWGRKGRFGVVPLADDRLYWFATVNSAANNPRFKGFSVADLKSWFDGYPAETREILDRTPDNALIWNDIIDIKPIPRYAFDNVLLVGDAAHATTPNMGQGACQAIEDAAVLQDELMRGGSIQEIFQRFERRRIKRTHFIINQSASVGKVAQVSHPLIIGIRNAVFRRLPERMKEKQFEKLYDTDF